MRGGDSGETGGERPQEEKRTRTEVAVPVTAGVGDVRDRGLPLLYSAAPATAHGPARTATATTATVAFRLRWPRSMAPLEQIKARGSARALPGTASPARAWRRTALGLHWRTAATLLRYPLQRLLPPTTVGRRTISATGTLLAGRRRPPRPSPAEPPPACHRGRPVQLRVAALLQDALVPPTNVAVPSGPVEGKREVAADLRRRRGSAADDWWRRR